MFFLYITMTSFILNVIIHTESHSAKMETGECLIFWKTCACLAVLGSIGKYNSPSIVDLIIFTLGNVALIILIVGCTLFRWADTAMKLPVHPESSTTAFSCSVYFIIFVVGIK